MLISISLCMIVKNEEDVLERCLKSVEDIVDEIIIVDTGSTDKTKDIARKFTQNVFDFEWKDDFAAARNFSFSKASKDYIFWMDADDVLLEEDRKKFKKLKETLSNNVDSVTMKYNIGFDEYGNVTFSCRRNRLVKRKNNFKWHGEVHEYLQVSGNIMNSSICVTHKKEKPPSDRNLNIYKKKLKRGDKFTEREVYYYANELYDHKFYDEALKYYEKFLNMNGWVEDKIFTCGRIADYYSSIGDYKKAREYCFKSYEYDVPRAEFCCRLGYCFLKENRLNEAVFWYEIASRMKKPKNNWGFFYDECWTWLPHLQLCVCYDKLGKHKLAYYHNEIARKYNPNNKMILYNKSYFENLGYK